MKSILIFMVILMPSTSYAEDQHRHETKAPSSGIESLSPELRQLLAKEMQSLQTGMQSIIPAYVSGDWKEIEQYAGKMEGGYILQQSLTDEQKQELHTSLPDAFLTLDQQFHYFAGRLKLVARNKNQELVGFYFSKLSETCVSCHAQYAKHRFPAFGSESHQIEHSH